MLSLPGGEGTKRARGERKTGGILRDGQKGSAERAREGGGSRLYSGGYYQGRPLPLCRAASSFSGAFLRPSPPSLVFFPRSVPSKLTRQPSAACCRYPRPLLSYQIFCTSPSFLLASALLSTGVRLPCCLAGV